MNLITGPPGIGKTFLALEVASRRSQSVIRGGGLPSLSHVAGLPLARAMGAPIPTDDLNLSVAMVRTAVGNGTLILDDAQWADPWSLDTVTQAAKTCRVVVTLRSKPNSRIQRQLERLCVKLIALDPIRDEDAERLLLNLNPRLGNADRAKVIGLSGGNPLALTRLAKDPSADGLRPSVARTLAGLSQPARTSLAACGLIGRPIEIELLGRGVYELASVGLIRLEAGLAEASPKVVAELAASMLSPRHRQDIHLALVPMLPPDEAAYHLAAAGRFDEAITTAREAADAAKTDGETNRLRLLAASLAPKECPEDVAIEGAFAALDLGDSHAAREIHRSLPSSDPSHGNSVSTRRAVLEARLAMINCDWRSSRQWLMLAKQNPRNVHDVDQKRFVRTWMEFLTVTDPEQAVAHTISEGSHKSDDPVVLTLIAIAHLEAGMADWEIRCREAIAMSVSRGHLLQASRCALLLVDTLLDCGRPTDAMHTASDMRNQCRESHLFSYELAFSAVLLWCRLHIDGALEEVIATGMSMLRAATADGTRARFAALVALAMADGGDFSVAEELLTTAIGQSRWETDLLTWTKLEVAFLAGNHGEVLATAASADRGPDDLHRVLNRVTRSWASWSLDSSDVPLVEGPPSVTVDPDLVGIPLAVSPHPYRSAEQEVFGRGSHEEVAGPWMSVMVREYARALWGLGLRGASNEDPVVATALTEAITVADTHGLKTFGDRIRRSLREVGGYVPPPKGSRTQGLSPRESRILELVGRGSTTREIAAALGLSPETVNTHLEHAKRKLGVRTRTAAAIEARRT